MSRFNEQIKLIRINRNMTQKEFATLINVAERAYQYYESGSRQPSLDKAIEIAEALDVSLDYLVGRSDNPKRN